KHAIADGSNEVFVSSASGWEIAIKVQLGKLKLPSSPEVFVSEQISHHAFQVLPITMTHALNVHGLPPLHKDPFDRMLVCQSQLEDMQIISADPLISQYGVDCFW
ncbi:MAG TPA: type II toxin-antitoxin system VapC family toxin, partial [Trichormus sp.]